MKQKSPTKAALIVNMRALNANCPVPPPKFRLPTLMEVGITLYAHCGASSPSSSSSSPSPSPCIATLDLANCFWSIRLPPSQIGCVRVGTPRHTYTFLCVPFGWTRAPALAQRVVHRHLTSSPMHWPPSSNQPAATHTLQYLDHIARLSRSPADLTSHLASTVSSITAAGFLIIPKSVLSPHTTATFIGKTIDTADGTISSLPAYTAGIVLQWLALATGPFTLRKASRLLGRLVWLAQPRRRILPFLAGPYAALRHGPRFSPRTSPRFTSAALEALAMAFPAWLPDSLATMPLPTAPRFFADAAQAPWGQYYAGVWEHRMGIRFFPCPPWVQTQQAAELFAAYKALSLAAFRYNLSFHLFLDNHAVIYSLLRGKARSCLLPQNRLLRRICHLLHWSGLTAALHYVPSSQNPADPPSRWWRFPTAYDLVFSTLRLGWSHLLDVPGPSWGLLHGCNRGL